MQGDFCPRMSQATPSSIPELAQWNHDYGDWFELGTVFTVIAGLLNLLAIYDAYQGRW
jgi:hypothetical protein